MAFAFAWPRIVAHRGAGRFAPENTLAAMKKGLEFGLRAVEFDVMLSADAVPVLMHDPQFGRTVSGSGAVATTLAADLLKMDAGSWFDAAYAGEPVPLYADIVRFCLANDIWMDVEIKPAPGFERITGEVVARLTDRLCDDPARLCFSSFSPEALAAARSTAPRWPRRLLVDGIPQDWPMRLAAVDAVALDCNHFKLNAKSARLVRDAGFGLFCYTVNEPERARQLFAWGVNALCTDRLDLFRDGRV